MRTWSNESVWKQTLISDERTTQEGGLYVFVIGTEKQSLFLGPSSGEGHKKQRVAIRRIKIATVRALGST